MRQQHLKSACLSLAGIALMGCAHARTPAQAPLAEADVNRGAVCWEAVELYSGSKELRASFQPVAVLNFTEEARLVNETLVMNAVRRKAAKMGANAVLLPTSTVLQQEMRAQAVTMGVATEPLNRSVAIYIPEDSARVRVTCNNEANGS